MSTILPTYQTVCVYHRVFEYLPFLSLHLNAVPIGVDEGPVQEASEHRDQKT
jgi:hypothetical protein